MFYLPQWLLSYTSRPGGRLLVRDPQRVCTDHVRATHVLKFCLRCNSFALGVFGPLAVIMR